MERGFLTRLSQATKNPRESVMEKAIPMTGARCTPRLPHRLQTAPVSRGLGSII
jgi:hypothetical protein